MSGDFKMLFSKMFLMWLNRTACVELYDFLNWFPAFHEDQENLYIYSPPSLRMTFFGPLLSNSLFSNNHYFIGLLV